MHNNRMKWIIFTVTTTGNFLGMLNSSSVNVALYEISKTFQIQITQVQWVVTAYLLVLTSLLTLFGKMNDTVDRRKLYASGFALFSLGSLLSYFAFSFSMLIIVRIIQSIGASILISNSYAIVSVVFKGEQRGKALGFEGAVANLGGLSGPVLSGFLMNYFSWRSVFIPAAVIGVIGVFLSLRFIPSIHTRKVFKFDYMGLIYFAVSTSCLLLAVSEGHEWGWFSVEITGAFILFALSGFLFYRHENKINDPIVDFSLFRSRMFTFCNLSMMISYFAMYSNSILFPFYSQEILKNSPLLTGLLILPFSLSFLIVAIVSSGITSVKPWTKMAIGGVMMILGLTIFALASETTPLYWFVIGQMIIGSGNAMFQPSSNVTIINAAPKKQIGMASGIMSLFRNTGIAMGTAFAVTAFDVFKLARQALGIPDAQAFLDGYHFTLYMGMVFGAACLGLLFAAYQKRGTVQ